MVTILVQRQPLQWWAADERSHRPHFHLQLGMHHVNRRTVALLLQHLLLCLQCRQWQPHRDVGRCMCCARPWQCSMNSFIRVMYVSLRSLTRIFSVYRSSLSFSLFSRLWIHGLGMLS